MSLRDLPVLGSVSGASPKPRRHEREKEERRDKRKEQTRQEQVKVYAHAREREICRCCRLRPTESGHELRPLSLGGKVSRMNTVAVCGLLVGVSPSCHTYLQQNQITYRQTEMGAEGTLWFTPTTKEAADWLKVKVGQEVVSPPMRDMEND